MLVVQAPESSEDHALQLYDVIEDVARKPVSSPDEFAEIVRELGEGGIVLKVRRVVDGESATRLIVWKQR